MSRPLYTEAEIMAAGAAAAKHITLDRESLEKVCAILAPVRDQIFVRLGPRPSLTHGLVPDGQAAA